MYYVTTSGVVDMAKKMTGLRIRAVLITTGYLAKHEYYGGNTSSLFPYRTCE